MFTKTTVGAIALAVATTLVTGACSDDEPAACVAVEELRSSIDDLQDLSVADDGIEALMDQVAVVRENAATARTEVPPELAQEVDAVGASIDGLETAVTAATATAEKAEALAVGLPAVRSALEALTSAITDTCD